MSITQEQIKKISKNLTRLPNPGEKMEKDINSIIGYIDVLNEIDTKNIKDTVSVSEDKEINVYEDKKVIENENPKTLLNSSKNKIIAGQIAIPNILG